MGLQSFIPKKNGDTAWDQDYYKPKPNIKE